LALVRSKYGSPLHGALTGVVIAIGLIVADSVGWIRPAADSIRQWFSATRPGWPLSVRLVVVAVAAVTGFLASIAVHEIGHVMAGLGLGFRFNSMRVGRLHLNRPFRWSWSRSVGRGAAGIATLFPVGTDGLSRRTLGMLLGGPAANLAAAGAIAALPFDKGPFSVAFVVWSLILGTMNLWSFRSGNFLSDGRRIAMLLRDPPRARRWLAMLTLNAELSEGVLPESLSPDFLANATAVRDDSLDTVGAHFLAYMARFSQHDDAGAADALEICLAHAGRAPEAVREALMCEAALFQARRRARTDLAQAWLADLPARTTFPGIREQAEVAILEAQGDRAGALAKLEEVEALLRDRPNAAQRDLSLRLLARWKADLEAK
jgi:hypothetical protein